MDPVNKKIGIGVAWNLVSLFASRGATTIFILFLAKLLSPEAFGLIAMASVVFELANVFVTSGMGAALIRSKSVNEDDLDTVFYTNLALSLIAYIIIFLSAPYLADFYRQEELTSLIQVMGIVVFANATSVVQLAVLSRNMDFKSQMSANTVSAILSGVIAIAAALGGMGVWSLAIQMLSAAIIRAAIFWLKSEWRPKLNFRISVLKKHFSFGKNLLIEGMLDVLFQNSYILVIGRFFSAEVTGLYYFARKISNLVSQQLTSAFQQATFPALATLQTNNLALRTKYRKILQVMIFIIAPIMAALAALSETVFLLAFSPSWQGAVPLLQLLCVWGLLYPVHALNVNLLNVKGRSDLVLKVGIIKKLVNLALLIVAVPFGITAVVVSQVIGSVLALIPNTYFSQKLIDYSLTEQIKDIFKPTLCAAIAGACSWGIMAYLSNYLMMSLLTGVFIITIVFAISSYLFRVEGFLLTAPKFMQLLKKYR